jgi:hypothetical protein
MDQPLEIPVRHRCHLGALVDQLAERAGAGACGDELAAQARAGLVELLASEGFTGCCVPKYLAVAPKVFERELQIPVASADPAKLDARVLLWPIRAKDAQHPHADGWAVFAAFGARSRFTSVRTASGDRSAWSHCGSPRY